MSTARGEAAGEAAETSQAFCGACPAVVPGVYRPKCEVLHCEVLRAELQSRAGWGPSDSCGDCPPAAGLTLCRKDVRTGLNLVCDTLRRPVTESDGVTSPCPVTGTRG